MSFLSPLTFPCLRGLNDPQGQLYQADLSAMGDISISVIRCPLATYGH